MKTTPEFRVVYREMLNQLDKKDSGPAWTGPLMLLDDLDELQIKVEKFKAVLAKIAEVKYGLDINDSDEEFLDYFAGKCRDYEKMARAAIED